MQSLTIPDRVKKVRLANGLTVLMETNPAAPVLSFHVGVKVGSAWEKDREAGLSHVLEHMVFKGTAHYGPGEIAKRVEAAGGELNAYTSFDQTVYYINLPSRNWKVGLALIKEMVASATIDPEELAREQEVIVEEIRRNRDNPHHLLSQMLFAAAFKKHTYGRPVIGFEKTVRGFDAKTVKNFYKKWYVPSNMILGVCGHFHEKEMRRAIAEEFGRLKGPPVKPPLLPREPAPKNFRTTSQTKPIEGNYIGLAYLIPPLKHRDTAPLDLLSHLLGSGETSRLVQIVKEQKGLATSINSYAYTPAHPGLFTIEANVPDAHISKIAGAILEEVGHFHRFKADPADLERAKETIRSGLYYEKETCEGVARKWVSFETTAGDFRYEQKYLDDVEKSTVDDVLRVARRYLVPRHACLAFLRGRKKKSSLSVSSSLNRSARLLTKKHPYELIESRQGIQKFRLPNGLIVLIRENRRLPLISLRQASMGGLRSESPSNNGISNLTSNIQEKGSTTKTALQVATIMEEMAGSLDASAGKSTWGLSSSFLSEKMSLGIDLFFDLLINPGFAPDEFEKEKKLVLEAIRQQADSPAQVAFQNFHRTLYRRHPYGRPLLGEASSIKPLRQKDIVAYYQRLLTAKGMVIAAAGDFDTGDLLDRFVEKTGSLPAKLLPDLRLKPDSPPRSIRRKIEKREKEQTHIVIGFMGTTITHPDRYPLEVLNNVLSGQGGRLFLRLRDEQSLAYTVTSTVAEGIEPGFFAAYIATEPGKAKRAMEGMLSQLGEVRDKGITSEELTRAQNYIAGNYEMDLQRNSAVAATLAFNELYGTGLDEFKGYPQKIYSVTKNDILRVARKYLSLNAYVLSVVGPT